MIYMKQKHLFLIHTVAVETLWLVLCRAKDLIEREVGMIDIDIKDVVKICLLLSMRKKTWLRR